MKLPPHVPGEAIVRLCPGRHGRLATGTVIERFELSRTGAELARLRLPDGMDVSEGLARLSLDPAVEYAVPNQIHRPAEAPSASASTPATGRTATGRTANDRTATGRTATDRAATEPAPNQAVDGRRTAEKQVLDNGHEPPLKRADASESSDLQGPDLTKEPDDYDPERLWGLERCSAPQAWQRTTGSHQGPIVAVIDTGCDVQHPDLVNNLWVNPGEIPGNGLDDDGNGVVDDVHGYNAIDNNGDLTDDYGHGTHCAGTIAAEGNNGQGVVGVNWQARLMPIKFMDEHGNGTTAALIRGVLYAERMGAHITSNSYGGEFNRAEFEVFREADHTLHLCAAGNEGRDNDVGQYYADRSASYPATYDLDQVVSVAALSSRDRLASFSNYGATTVDLAAPGTRILSTVPGGGYETKSGTSMATPHVAGAAALIATVYPEASPAELKARLLNSVDPLPNLKGQALTGGTLNVAAALAEAGPRLDPPAPPTPSALNWRGFDLSLSSDPRARRVQIEAGGERFSGPQIRLWPSDQARDLQVEVRQADWTDALSEPTRLEVCVPAATIALDEIPDPQGSRPFQVPSEACLFLEGDFDLQPVEDSLLVQVQGPGETRWKTIADYSGRGWQRKVLDLGSWAGQTVRLRLHEDVHGAGTGVKLARVTVAGPGPQPDQRA